MGLGGEQVLQDQRGEAEVHEPGVNVEKELVSRSLERAGVVTGGGFSLRPGKDSLGDVGRIGLSEQGREECTRWLEFIKGGSDKTKRNIGKSLFEVFKCNY